MGTIHQMARCRLWQSAMLWSVLLAASVAQEDDVQRAIEQEQPQRPPHAVIVRLSDALLTGLFNRSMDVQLPVNDVVLGTPVSGVARVVGRSHVELAPSPSAAKFAVVYKGTVHSRTVGRKGPAIINGHSITHFTATKEIAFQPGVGFYSLPPRIEARSECFTDGISATRGGVIGRIIQRRAAREIAAQQDQITTIARDRAARRIAAALDARMSERLVGLNRMVEVRTALVGLDRPSGRFRIACCTTPHALLIATQRTEEHGPIQFPFLTTMDEMAAPIEIWIHGSLVPEKLGQAIKTIFSNPEQSAIVNTLALLPGELGKDAAAAIAAFASENHVSLERIGDWVVLDVHVLPPADFAATGNIRR